tara:strand:- start:5883 stop:6212 length:330 start_codon:yes stop_codon:yes gene_type:complete
MCDLLEYRAHAWGGSNKRYCLGGWIWRVLLAEDWLCHSAKDSLKLCEIEWLREEVNDAKLPRGNGVLDFAVSSDNYGRGPLRCGQRCEKFKAILIWQANIKDHCMVVPF